MLFISRYEWLQSNKNRWSHWALPRSVLQKWLDWYWRGLIQSSPAELLWTPDRVKQGPGTERATVAGHRTVLRGFTPTLIGKPFLILFVTFWTSESLVVKCCALLAVPWWWCNWCCWKIYDYWRRVIDSQNRHQVISSNKILVSRNYQTFNFVLYGLYGD